MRQLLRLLPLLCLCGVMVGCSGCGGVGGNLNLAKTTGIIKHNGSPLEGATVSFHATSKEGGGQVAIGQTDKDGKFTLTTAGRAGAPLGTCAVTVSKMSGPAAAGPAKTMTAEDMMNRQKNPQASDEPKSLIPTKYNNPAESGLNATVDKDAAKNVFEFNVLD